MQLHTRLRQNRYNRKSVWVEGHMSNFICRLRPHNGLIGEGIKFQRIRRVTGYLVGTLDRFNNAKRAEEHDRVKHMHV